MNDATLRLVGRVLLGLLFVMAGIGKLSGGSAGMAGLASFIGSKGLPAPMILAWLAAIFEVVAGLMVIVGFKTRLASWALAAFCVFTAVVFHNNFGVQSEMTAFLKNPAIAGGFLILATTGPGSLSIDHRRG